MGIYFRDTKVGGATVAIDNEVSKISENAIENQAITNYVDNNFSKQDGTYPLEKVGNLASSTKKSWFNTFIFGSTGGSADIQDGEAEVLSMHGHTAWNESIPSYVNIEKLYSTKTVNLFNGISVRVIKNAEYMIAGAYTSIKLYSDESLSTLIGTLSVTTKTNTTGDTYNSFTPNNEGWIKIEGSDTTTQISLVWSGQRVKERASYSLDTLTINTHNYFSTGMKSIQFNGEDVVYDELTKNRKFERVGAITFSSATTLTSQGTTGSYNLYSIPLTAYANGYAFIGNSTKFTLLTTAITTSSSLTADSMCLKSNAIWFAITKEEDTDYTYTQDTSIVDAETFTAAKTAHGAIYKQDGTSYVEVETYDPTINAYFYRTEVSKAGSTILDEIVGKTCCYQVKAMSKTSYTGVAITAINLSYEVCDVGYEWLDLHSGFTATPTLEISYYMNIRDFIQRYQEHMISTESFDNLTTKIKDVAGLDIKRVWNESKNEYDFDVVDTKETIVEFNTNYLFNYSEVPIGYANRKPLPKETEDILQKYLYSRDNGALKILRIKETNYVVSDCFVISKKYGVNSKVLTQLQFIHDGRVYSVQNIDKNPTWYRNM